MVAWSVLNQCPNADIQIGRWWSGDLQSFQGKIDELRIYDRAINQDEINTLCNCSVSADFGYTQAPCDPLQVSFTSTIISGISYLWNIEGIDHAPTDPSDAGLTYTFNYPQRPVWIFAGSLPTISVILRPPTPLPSLL